MKDQRQMTPDEKAAAKALLPVTFPPASWDKCFTRDVCRGDAITEAQAPQLWRLFKRYRRQITCPDKERLLAIAEDLAAPDYRKLAAQDAERARYQQTMAGKA